MKMSRCLMLACVAGGIAAPAFAQNVVNVGPENMTGVQVPGYFGANGEFVQTGPMPAAFGSRAGTPVYDSYTGTPNAITSAFNGMRLAGDDLSFVGGPWAGVPGAQKSLIELGGVLVGRSLLTPAASSNTSALPGIANVVLRVAYFDAYDYTSVTGVPTGAAAAQVNIAFGAAQVNPGQLFVWNIGLAAPLTVNVDDSAFMTYSWFDSTNTTPLPSPHEWRFGASNILVNAVGSSDSTIFVDRGDGTVVSQGGDGILQGGTATFTGFNGILLNTTPNTFPLSGISTQAVERNSLVLTNPAKLSIIMRATLPTPTPTVFTDVGGCLNSAETVVTNSDAPDANGVRWFKFCLNGDVQDANLSFLDITTDGTASGNTAVGLYSNSGAFIGYDELDGPGDLAQLSLGVGNRSGDGDGSVFMGWDGQVNAGDGPFWLGVVQGPATAGQTDGVGSAADGFAIRGTGSLTGSVTVKLRTNSYDPITNPAAPSVPPSLTGGLAGDLGQILFPGVPGTSDDLNPPEVKWKKFEICAPVALNDATTTNYYDFDFSGTNAGSDSVAYIFNSAGQLVFFSDDAAAGYNKAQFSFGNSSTPRTAAAPVANQPQFAGQDGALTNGVYYLAYMEFNGDLNDVLVTEDRWHVRPDRPESGLDHRVDIITEVAACSTGPTCNDLDFNNDGQIEPGDVDAYFSILGEGPCLGDIGGGCDSLDFNNDGNIEPEDVDAYFSVLGEGPCINN